MWLIAGVLIGALLVGVLAGFHVGPHAHAIAGVAGALAAIWLLVMAADGRNLGLVIVLFVAVLAVTATVAALAYKGLTGRPAIAEHARSVPIEGEPGTAVTELAPSGIVRVNGENWTALTLNGTVHAGARVQVINAKGVHLEVWGEENDLLSPPAEPGTPTEGSPQ